MSEPAVAFQGTVKHYGSVRALRGIDLEMQPGEIFGFLGPNGAGKSTAIRILLDLIRPTAGTASVFGHDCQAQSVAARRLIGYLPSDPLFPPKMTALEVFDYTARIRGRRDGRAYVDSLIERLGLDPTRRVSTLSRGNRQKVGVIRALLARPPLLVLDEPTTGLDPLVQHEVETVLREVVAEGRSVFFSSHILQEVEDVCTRAAIIRDGSIVQVFDLAEQRRLAPTRVEVTFAQPPPEGAFATLAPSILVMEDAGARVTFEVRDGFDPLIKSLSRFQVKTLVAREPTLEEVFIQHYRAQDESRGDAS
jgi:ABC-2 type transport system ATP-binding protein